MRLAQDAYALLDEHERRTDGRLEHLGSDIDRLGTELDARIQQSIAESGCGSEVEAWRRNVQRQLTILSLIAAFLAVLVVVVAAHAFTE